MHPTIQKAWQRLEQKRQTLFAELDKIDPSVLDTKPAPDKWSVNQILLHLMEAEAASLRYIRKKLSYGDNIPKAGLAAWLRQLSLRIAFILPLKFKAPLNLGDLPESSDYPELNARWERERTELAQFIGSLEDRLLHAELWKHAMAGKMSIVQMIDFTESHFDRHREQIERTLKLVGK